MADPVSPVVKGLEPFEIVFGENQPGVIPLAVLRKPDGCQISRWALTDEERKAITEENADIFVFQHTYFHAPQPLDVQVFAGTINAEKTKKALGLNVELNHRITNGNANKSPDMLIVERTDLLTESPTMFTSPEVYFDIAEMLVEEHRNRPAAIAEMDFEEWKVAEIIRLRKILWNTVKTL